MNQNYTTSFTVDQTPEQVFAAITNLRGWWSEVLQGRTDQVGDVFYYYHKNLHRCTMIMTEQVPNQKVIWRVLDNYFNFVADQSEWKGTELQFEVAQKGGQTEVRFTHAGLVPAYECFEICSNAWGFYINTSLRELIITGKGQPNNETSSNTVDVVETEKDPA